MSRSELLSRDPCTGAVIWRGEASDAADVDTAIDAARRAAAGWSGAALQTRRDVALVFARLVTERREEIARLISQETGKPFWETLTEADSVAAKVAISIRAQDQRAGESFAEVAGARQALRHRPHGVLAVLGPFNFPMHLANGHIVPALLAGNAVVFKPSEKTPASGARMAELWSEAGLPAGVMQLVQGGREVGARLVAHDHIDGVLFTGSVGAGQAIHRSLASSPWKILALELGGNNPLIAWDVEDMESAAHLIVQSAFISAGQRCSCARKLVIEAGEPGDRLIDALTGVMDRLRVGAPFDDPEPYLGPVIDNGAADSLLHSAARLAASGGRAIRPLERLERSLPLLKPGLIDVTAVRDLPDEELFGPLLLVVRVGSLEDALGEAGQTRFGLAAGLIGGDERLFDRFWRSIRAGVVNWNRPTTGASSAAPFGGVGASGNHRPSAFYAADYCAYPVAGLESADTRFRLGNGLTPVFSQA
jgi:succinylglutamic semialdehyde dehydrogenase